MMASSGVAASSSSASALPGAVAAQNDEGLPAQLLQALKRARPPCPFFSTKHGCRKGRKCKLSHGGENEDHIPHCSRHVAKDGRSYITLRPPLMQGLARFFSDRNCPMPISNGKTWRLEDGTFAVTFATPLMDAPDLFTRKEAATRGFAEIGSQKFYRSSCEFSGLILHSTSVPSALNILVEGRINTSPGTCGQGIYGFQTDSQEQDALGKAWQRGVSGGCGWGAAFLLECPGLVVNGDQKHAVPPGCVARKKDQFAVAERAATYVSVTFARDVIIGAINKEMNDVGYSQELHSALVDLQDHFDSCAAFEQCSCVEA